MYSRFIALDFETANYDRNSACSVGIAVVENMQVTEQVSFLIRPPANFFTFTHIHGLTWNDVKDEPSFDEVWILIEKYFHNIDFVAAHNASFDRAVLEASCNFYGIKHPKPKYKCSLKLSKKCLPLEHHTLSDVASHYKIALNHHEALSDATACAKIMINLIGSK